MSRDADALGRERMLRTIRETFVRTAEETGLAAPGPGVERAMAAVPRDRFVPPELRTEAWDDAPLPIGHGATISQPFIVALMTTLAHVGPGTRALEVGTGCGYQAAVLAALGAEVWSVEVVPELARDAAARLQALGHHQIHVRAGNGHLGWPEHAPYDAILVTAAAAAVPPALLEQLAPGGRLVIPIGAPWRAQHLMLLSREAGGGIRRREVLAVAFVPMQD
ncbi:MAG: protein-L-isoaspartate(D-aspartate) O-methyltransferase [Ectothiorhodospiraceae bacterium]|nr:protein-L-isoaspartate(D-aspartate) O-methyltransferase [Chromatiales bacterium]MCP5156555.1 protein-L-isoaspartate(D-aspartate) O-methyltransferase [Ectothiorhodospiraceae bacterium]